MLRKARRRLALLGDRWRLIWQDADILPFPDDTFDAVTCLETLEFTPRPQRALDELVRVVRPGGVLLLTNRIGRARWFPRRVYDDDALSDLLKCYPLRSAQIHNWNSFYDLVWARKVGQASDDGRGACMLASWLRPPGGYDEREGIARPRKPASHS